MRESGGGRYDNQFVRIVAVADVGANFDSIHMETILFTQLAELLHRVAENESALLRGFSAEQTC